MTHRESAGLVMFRWRAAAMEVLLGHPGGPYWTTRHEGAWSIPKGGILPGEDPIDGAIREFIEETGFTPAAPYIPLGSIVQRSGKVVHAWGFEGDCDPTRLVSIMATTEWPPRSGRVIEIPEFDRVAFFGLPEARQVINVAQAELLERLSEKVQALKP